MAKHKTNRISEFRKLRGMTQQQLADSVGAHWITISKLERGHMKLTFEWVSKFSRALNVDLFDLYPEEELSRLAIVTGFVHEKGRIKLFSEREEPISCLVDIGFGESPGSRWLYVDTYDLVPIFHSGDIIRTEELELQNVDILIDRLCFARFEDARDKDVIGVITRGAQENRYDIRPLNGAPLTNVMPSSISRVTMAVFAPKQFMMAGGGPYKGRT